MTEYIPYMVLTSASLSFYFYRRQCISTLTKEVKKRLPSDKTLLWHQKDDKERTRIENKGNESFTIGDAAVAGVVGGLPYMHYANQIDDHVLSAMDFAFTTDVSNFHDLHSFVSEKYLDAVSESSADGWMTRLEGYVTEQIAAEHFEQLGFEVEFPESANQAGYDLLVDGQAWQVKGGVSESIITSHFEKYEDIPVITGTDLADKVDNMDSVFGVEALNHEGIEQLTEASLEGIDDLGDYNGMGIPVITLALSSFREWQLLTDDKTEFKHSLKNIGLDVAGVGAGGMAGAKAGSLVGAIGGPIGVAVGGVIGGVAGAIAGRQLTNSIKMKPFHDAKENYEMQISVSKFEVDMFQEEERLTLQNSFQDIHDELQLSKEQVIHLYKQKIQQHKDESNRKKQSLRQDMPTILREIKDELKQKEVSLFSIYEPRHPWIVFLLPNKEEIYMKEAEKWFQRCYVILDDAIYRYEKMGEKQALNYEELLLFFKEYYSDHERIHQHVMDIYEHQEEIQRLSRHMQQLMIQQGLKAEKKARIRTKDSFENIQQFFAKQLDSIQGCIKDVKREGERLGIL